MNEEGARPAGRALTTMDLQRRSCIVGDQDVMSPSWLQQTSEPSEPGASTMRSTGSRCGVAHVRAGSWKPTCRSNNLR